MGQIDPFHRRQGAEIFLMALSANQANVPMIGLSALYDDDSSLSERHILTAGELDHIFVSWQPRLQNRCRDLMELNRNTSCINQCEQYEVEFLHRTVRDFLQEHYVRELRLFVPSDFRESACLARLTIVLIDQVSLDNSLAQRDSLGFLIRSFFSYAIDATPSNPHRVKLPIISGWVDDFEKTVEHVLASSTVDRSDSWAQFAWGRRMDFISVAAELGLRDYSLHRLREKQQREWPKEQARSYLHCALFPKLREVGFPDPKLIEGLCELGMNPNTCFNSNYGRTARNCFLRVCLDKWASLLPTDRTNACNAIRVLIRHGAKTDIIIDGWRLFEVLGRSSWFSKFFSSSFRLR
ncbi:hypothetical protein F5Y16DRAFT_371375 [Xylariaceae sp. FL0255]|nr:hypothetical protein F5Y16DRAFT_371375 [Xylariaceae sp. FL0255]